MREKLKNGLIVVLIISAVVLGWQSGLFGNTAGELGVFSALFQNAGAGAPADGSIKTQASGAAMPVCIVYTTNSGSTALHYGVRYDQRKLTEAYEDTVLIMSSAFGNASPPVEIEEQSWQAALLSQGIYFEYLYPVKISILDGWFGTEVTDSWGDTGVRRLCVVKTGNSLRLFFEEYDTGRFFAADTSGGDNLETVVDSFGVNRAIFAFEVSEASADRDLYALLMPDVTAYDIVYAGNPMRDEAVKAKALESLGIINQSAYHAPSGDVLYLDDKFVLTLRQDGTVIYRVSDKGTVQKSEISEGEAVELARRAVTENLEPFCGDAAVYFETITGAGGSYLVTFRYLVAGGPIHLYQDGYAAAITIREGSIAEMELRYRKYTLPGTREPLLPEIQVAAAAEGPFTICYADNGGNGILLSPFWASVPDYRQTSGE
jgi:hypothetical protein